MSILLFWSLLHVCLSLQGHASGRRVAIFKGSSMETAKLQTSKAAPSLLPGDVSPTFARCGPAPSALTYALHCTQTGAAPYWVSVTGGLLEVGRGRSAGLRKLLQWQVNTDRHVLTGPRMCL